MKRVIVWFRRDLRLSDHPALHWAAASGLPILPLYIHAPDEEAPWQPGGASRWWLQQSLGALRQHLQQAGLSLRCYRGPTDRVFEQLVQGGEIAALCYNRSYEPHLAQRDGRLERRLQRSGVEVRTFDAGLLFPPGAILNGQQQPYRVFTPFWRRARARLDSVLPAPLPLPAGPLSDGWCNSDPADEGLAGLGLLDRAPWYHKLNANWRPGEAGAGERLDRFLSQALASYSRDRELPALEGSSLLSPHLHFGEVTPLQLLHRLLADEEGVAPGERERFLSELGWREFAHQVLWHFPHTAREPMNRRFDDRVWPGSEALLARWQAGETGVSLVDAGMRQLWESGWMHNRVRMVVGSFLTKNLGVHWRAGARWFWYTLVDADLASNTLGWQWVAGCGVDAAPYFRIFNPQTQAARFDPDGSYRRRWLGDRFVDRPMVDLAESRAAALARYRSLRDTTRAELG